jgi:hypothetical protein
MIRRASLLILLALTLLPAAGADQKYPETVSETASGLNITYKLAGSYSGITPEQPIAPGERIYFLHGIVLEARRPLDSDTVTEGSKIYDTEYRYGAMTGDLLKIKYTHRVVARQVGSVKESILDDTVNMIGVPLDDKRQGLLTVLGDDDYKVYYVPEKKLLISVIDDAGRIIVKEATPPLGSRHSSP